MQNSGKRRIQGSISFSGTEAELRFGMEIVDMVILDLMMPGMDGESLLRKIRTDRKSEIPALVLSAKSALEDKVTLLTSGADDYMTKPFEPDELLARVYALLRRSGAKEERPEAVFGEQVLTFKSLKLLKKGRQVSVKEKHLHLHLMNMKFFFSLWKSRIKFFKRKPLREGVERRILRGGQYGKCSCEQSS